MPAGKLSTAEWYPNILVLLRERILWSRLHLNSQLSSCSGSWLLDYRCVPQAPSLSITFKWHHWVWSEPVNLGPRIFLEYFAHTYILFLYNKSQNWGRVIFVIYVPMYLFVYTMFSTTFESSYVFFQTTSKPRSEGVAAWLGLSTCPAHTAAKSKCRAETTPDSGQ